MLSCCTTATSVSHVSHRIVFVWQRYPAAYPAAFLDEETFRDYDTTHNLAGVDKSVDGTYVYKLYKELQGKYAKYHSKWNTSGKHDDREVRLSACNLLCQPFSATA